MEEKVRYIFNINPQKLYHSFQKSLAPSVTLNLQDSSELARCKYCYSFGWADSSSYEGLEFTLLVWCNCKSS